MCKQECYLNSEDIDMAAQHLYKKEKRAISIAKQKAAKRKQVKILNQIGYRPSIFAETKWDADSEDYQLTGRVKRASNSQMQKDMKRHSNKIVRRLPFEEISGKSNQYRRYFDYWWTWI